MVQLRCIEEKRALKTVGKDAIEGKKAAVYVWDHIVIMEFWLQLSHAMEVLDRSTVLIDLNTSVLRNQSGKLR